MQNFDKKAFKESLRFFDMHDNTFAMRKEAQLMFREGTPEDIRAVLDEGARIKEYLEHHRCAVSVSTTSLTMN